jgi:hypothetical protein
MEGENSIVDFSVTKPKLRQMVFGMKTTIAIMRSSPPRNPEEALQNMRAAHSSVQTGPTLATSGMAFSERAARLQYESKLRRNQ